MALIKCPECGEKISDKSERCIHCGYPLSNIKPPEEEKRDFIEEQNDIMPQQEIEEHQNKISTPKRDNMAMPPTYEKSQRKGCLIISLICLAFLIFVSLFLKENYAIFKITQTIWILAIIIGMPFSLGYLLLNFLKGYKLTKPLKFLTATVIVFCACIFIAGVSEPQEIKDERQAKIEQKEETEEEKAEASEKVEEPETEKNETKSEVKEEESEINENYDFSGELEIFNTNNYPYISPDDLGKYFSNMSGVNVYTVITVDDINEDNIQSSISNGYMFSEFCLENAHVQQKDFINKDDKIAIMATVDNFDTYSFLGTSVKLKDCIIFAKDEEASKYQKETSDEVLSQYFVLNENVANTAKIDLTEDEFKGLCNSLDHNDILRNPDNYNNKFCVINGKVSQIIESFLGVTIYITDGNGNQWGCTYNYKDGESHLLENDYITVYGKCNGTTKVKTLSGKQVILPYVNIEYIN